MQPFHLAPPPDIPPPKNPAELAAAQQQQQGKVLPVNTQGRMGHTLNNKMNIPSGSSVGELLEQLKPIIEQMIVEEVERRVAIEIENIRENQMFNGGK